MTDKPTRPTLSLSRAGGAPRAFKPFRTGTIAAVSGKHQAAEARLREALKALAAEGPGA